jgi:succinate dehydrogenase/fumarate reductase flavoprotein subunit
MTGALEHVDCTVVGGGMSGMAAALTAAEQGCDVLLLEKADRPGGSAAISGGLVWTDPSFRDLRARMPGGDPELGRALVEGYEDGVTWLRRQGVEMTERLTGLFGTGVGHRVGDMPRAVELLSTRLERAGGRIVCGARATELERDGEGRVTGVAATTADGTLRVRAGAVILCTGGFQADRDLVAEHIGADPENLVVRAAPHSTGDGLRLALSAGATLSEGMEAFYGHLMPAPPARIAPDRILFLTQYYSHHCVLLNREGRRFVDESAADEVSTQALARQPGSLGFLVLDAGAAEHVRDPVAAGFPPVDRHAELQAAGGRVHRAEDLDAVERALEAAGADGAAGRRELEAYNAAIADGRDPDVPRRQRRRALTRPPFLVVPVVPGITFTEGGVRIDVDGRALGADGRPVPGLYAAGADGGHVFFEHYAGGLALSLVFGRRAGAHAAAHAAGRRESRRAAGAAPC